MTNCVLSQITKFVHEPNDVTYLEFYISVAQKDVNRTVVVETFRVEDVNILTTAIKFQVYSTRSLQYPLPIGHSQDTYCLGVKARSLVRNVSSEKKNWFYLHENCARMVWH